MCRTQVEIVPFWRDLVGLAIALTAVAAVAADGTVVLWESLSFLGLCPQPTRACPSPPAPPPAPPPAAPPAARPPVRVVPRLRPVPLADAPLSRCRRALRAGRAGLARPGALLLGGRGGGGRGGLGLEVAAASAPGRAPRGRASRTGVGVRAARRAFGRDFDCGCFGCAAAHGGPSSGRRRPCGGAVG